MAHGFTTKVNLGKNEFSPYPPSPYQPIMFIVLSLPYNGTNARFVFKLG
jgi:hypothetical protein